MRSLLVAGSLLALGACGVFPIDSLDNVEANRQAAAEVKAALECLGAPDMVVDVSVDNPPTSHVSLAASAEALGMKGRVRTIASTTCQVILPAITFSPELWMDAADKRGEVVAHEAWHAIQCWNGRLGGKKSHDQRVLLEREAVMAGQRCGHVVSRDTTSKGG